MEGFETLEVLNAIAAIAQAPPSTLQDTSTPINIQGSKLEHANRVCEGNGHNERQQALHMLYHRHVSPLHELIYVQHNSSS
jgi:hypothetical protein